MIGRHLVRRLHATGFLVRDPSPCFDIKVHALEQLVGLCLSRKPPWLVFSSGPRRAEGLLGRRARHRLDEATAALVDAFAVPVAA
jgi:hypothetical protein